MPAWNIPGYCYLITISPQYLDKSGMIWPQYLTIAMLSQFPMYYRQYIPFNLEEVVTPESLETNYHAKLNALARNQNHSWSAIDVLSKTTLGWRKVGGEGTGLTASVKIFNGSNYHEWARNIQAYLQTQALWAYTNGRKVCPELPAEVPVPLDGALESVIATYDTYIVSQNATQALIDTWEEQDQKARGALNLQILESMKHVVRNTSRETWTNMAELFDSPGAAAIFVDYRAAVGFRMKEHISPSVQIVELLNITDHLSSRGLELDNMVKSMIVLASLPQSWDSIASTVLSQTEARDLNLQTIMPLLQDKFTTRNSRQNKNQGDNKVNFAKTDLKGGPKCQQWHPNNYYNNNYSQPQAGPSNQGRLLLIKINSHLNGMNIICNLSLPNLDQKDQILSITE
jgi:hypothetical protein